MHSLGYADQNRTGMTPTEQIYYSVVLSLLVASISWTVTQEEIFAELREICGEKCKTERFILARKFFYVFTCEYCFSHWVTLAVLVMTGFRLLLDDWRGSVIAFFVLPWLANQWMSLYRHIRVAIKYENTLAENEEHEK